MDIRPDRVSDPLSALVPLHPPEAVHAVALDAVQLRVLLPPLDTELGEAVKLTAGGDSGGAGETVTVTDCVALAPPVPVQVSVNVDVEVRPVRASVPLSALLPVQPPLAVHTVALAAVQASVDVPPFATVVGVADSVTVGDGGADGGVTVTVTDCDAVPPVPVHASV